jgi:hypothetical protein
MTSTNPQITEEMPSKVARSSKSTQSLQEPQGGLETHTGLVEPSSNRDS